MEPGEVDSYARQIAAEIYAGLRWEDRQAVLGGEFPLSCFEQATDRFRTDHYPENPSPQWSRDFSRELQALAIRKQGQA